MIVCMRRILVLAMLVTAVWLPPRSAAATDPAAVSQPAPAGIAVDSEGNVYVSDYALDRLVKFGPDGTVLSQWGSTGSALGQFNAPFGVALDERNTLYVVDQLNNRLQRFSSDGSPMGAWGVAGAGSGELRTPFGVAVGGGRVYVADFGNDRVQVYGSDGALVTTLGGRGSGDGQFLRPAGVALGPDGTLYVTDHFKHRVERFSSEGRFQAQLGTVQLTAASAATATAVKAVT